MGRAYNYKYWCRECQQDDHENCKDARRCCVLHTPHPTDEDYENFMASLEDRED